MHAGALAVLCRGTLIKRRLDTRVHHFMSVSAIQSSDTRQKGQIYAGFESRLDGVPGSTRGGLVDD